MVAGGVYTVSRPYKGFAHGRGGSVIEELFQEQVPVLSSRLTSHTMLRSFQANAKP